MIFDNVSVLNEVSYERRCAEFPCDFPVGRQVYHIVSVSSLATLK